MSAIITPKSGLLFMKVGRHAGEAFGDILQRKRLEYQRTGMIFWGYGGNTCHPIRHVQPFARLRFEEGQGVYLVMEEIDSRHAPTSLVASHYSEDGLKWQPMPAGVEVRGSRYALILGELQDGALDIDLSNYEVAAGPSLGKRAVDYISGRVDKACLVPAAHTQIGAQQQIRRVNHYAGLKAPYAVLIK